MQEKSKNTGVVPVDITILPEAHALTAFQKGIVANFAIDYLRKNRLPFQKDNLEKAIDVLVNDALPRAVVSEGLNDLSLTNITKLLRVGLQKREEIKAKADQALGGETNIKDIIASSHGPFVGEYAYETDFARRLILYLPVFAMTSDISDYEKLIRLYEFRKESLPLVAEAVIAKLPREIFPEATIDKFPDPQSQARIVRNSLVSQAFRGSSLPHLLVEDLEKIVSDPQLNEKLGLDIVSQFVEDFSQYPFFDNKEVIEYLHALLGQAKGHLTRKLWLRPSGSSNRVNTRDSMFQALSRHFLLMHPALEERLLITNQDQYSPDEHSLWSEDLSIVIDNFRVPTVEALQKAARYISAKGYAPETFRQAINLWRQFQISEGHEKEKIVSIGQKLAQSQETLRNLRRKSELPKSAIDNALRFRTKRVVEYLYAKSDLENLESIIRNIKDKSDYAQAYLDKLLRSNKGKLPNEAHAPEFEARKTKSGLKGSIELKKETALRFLEEDLLTKDLPDIWGIYNWDNLSLAQLRALIDKTWKRIPEIEKGGDLPPKFPQFNKIEVFVNDYISSIERKIPTRVKNRVRIPAGYKEKYEKLKALQRQIWNAMFASEPEAAKEQEEVRREFYLYSLQNQLQALKQLKQSKIRREEIDKNLFEVIWGAEQIMSWVKVLKASNLDTQEFTLNELERLWNQIADWKSEYRKLKGRDGKIILPQKNLNSDDMRIYLDNTERKLLAEESKKDTKPLRRVRIFESLRVLRHLRTISQNPLFPWDELEGVNQAQFLTCLETRLNLARVIFSLPQARERHKKAKEDFENFAKGLYKDSLSGEIIKLNKDLLSFEGEPTKENFLRKMGDLRLLVPITQPE